MKKFIIKKGEAVRVLCMEQEQEAVHIAVSNLKRDLNWTLQAEITDEEAEATVFIGTIGVTPVLNKYINIEELQDEHGLMRREAYILKVCDGTLVIAGTDRRGTIYGIYEFCQQLGVSPWYYWGDVPVKNRSVMELDANFKKIDYPSIEYRGIFINDEEELNRWVQNHMGELTIGVKTYEKIFELLLRLKANYIWPAMHVNSFNLLKENGALAERMGIVVGTSHCDMMMRSNNREWVPWLEKKGYKDVYYDYSIEGSNREKLVEYWRESVEQNREFEVSYTMGMRGIHDSGFETRALKGSTQEELRGEKICLLENVIDDQMSILNEASVKQSLKLFIPYKEVMELYDHGLQVPEDLTIVWANDNYGYIRRYPSEKEKERKGGHGIYYHNSYWAPPGRSYVFLGSIPLAHTKYEMEKAYAQGIRKLWILNVGALKPLELETEFFLTLAWEAGKTERITADVETFISSFMERNFSGNFGPQVASLFNEFYQLANVRKIEHMDNAISLVFLKMRLRKIWK